MRRLSTFLFLLYLGTTSFAYGQGCGEVLTILHQTVSAKSDKEMVENIFKAMESNKHKTIIKDREAGGTLSIPGYADLGYDQKKKTMTGIIERHKSEDNYSLSKDEVIELNTVFYSDGSLKTVVDAWLRCTNSGSPYLTIDHNSTKEVIVSLIMPLNEQNRDNSVQIHKITPSSNLILDAARSGLKERDELRFGLSRSIVFKREDDDEGDVGIQLVSGTVDRLKVPSLAPVYTMDTVRKQMQLTVNGDLTNGMFRINHPINPEHWEECKVTETKGPRINEYRYTANCENIRTYLPVADGNMVENSIFTDTRKINPGEEANYTHIGTGVNKAPENTFTFHGKFTPQSSKVIQGKITVYYITREKRCVKNCQSQNN